MKKIILVVFVFLLCLITVGLLGSTQILLWVLGPNMNFEDAAAPPAPDYHLENNWAALPTKDDLSDLRPLGVEPDTLLKEIDVFFIHPTGYLKGHTWNAAIDTASATAQNTEFMLANQASVFSDCLVYAPYYRQATIFSFFDLEDENAQKALDLAYSDVKRSFEYFLSSYNRGRPFIIASHSQGSHHAIRLIREEIDQSEYFERLIAAYTIGIMSITDDAVSELINITVCNSYDQTNCIIHWATFGERADIPKDWNNNLVCVNPLSWKRDEIRVNEEEHLGFVSNSGEYNLKFYGNDEKEDVEFQPLSKPQLGYTWAKCVDGSLIVKTQEGHPDVLGKGNYHGLDFQLFHMNIRRNLSDRVRAYFDNHNITI